MDATNKMDGNHDNAAVWGWSAVGTAIGAIANLFGLLSEVPPWIKQAVGSLVIGTIGLIGHHFLKRWLNGRWPTRRRRGDSRDTDS
ncbi:MAG TPA: hypothetical protein PKC13_00195 [Blastocatellia bacterium]|nr:hypothetical protein [Blastocatellia bacterium]HMY70705.1 hypothetical protein [Blastocatellia bacterium]